MSSATESGTLYLVDAHTLIFQVFHAIRGMTSPSGLPTNALFGFARDLLFLRGLRPDYLVCAFDRAEPTFRSAIYTDYKAHREEIPNDLQLQLPHIHRLLEAMNVPVVSVAGFEADDVLATLAAAAPRGLDVYLCTSDKDCRQLIDDRVRLYSLRKRQVFGRDELLADWGIKPEQVVDLQTLVGDSVDNVPGVPGIGIKTAAKLLQDFGTLQNILANIDRVPGAKRQQSLRDSAAIMERTRQLVRLDRNVPIQLDWDGWRLRDLDASRLRQLFQEWGFHSLSQQFHEAERNNAPLQGELFPFGANAPDEADEPAVPAAKTDNWQADYHLVDSEDKFEAFYRRLSEQKRIAFDLETTSLSPLQAEIVGFAFSWHAGEAWYLPLRGPQGAAVLDPETTLARLRPILEDAGVAKVNQNIKYDLLVLRGHGVQPRGVAGDPMVADYLLHAGERSHGLEELSRRYLNHQVIPITDLIGKKSRKTPQLSMDQVPTERVAVYSGEDADVAWRLCELLEAQLNSLSGGRQPPESASIGGLTPPAQGTDASPLRKLYDDVEIPLIEVLAELEYHGIRLDIPLLHRLSADMGQQLAAIEKEIYDLAGHVFNIGSLVQLRKVLFEELKLPVQGRTGVTGAASTDQETLEKLAALDHAGAALPRKILEHRRIAKLKSTYVDALPEMVNPTTGRVHTAFNQTVASTGRLSSSDPNLAEHSGAPRGGAADSPSISAGRGLVAVDGGLFADRTTSARAFLRRCRTAPRLRRGARHPCRRGRADFRRAGSGSHGQHAAHGQDGQFRGDLRHQPHRFGPAFGNDARRGGKVHRRLFRSLSEGAGISGSAAERLPRKRLRIYDPRPAAALRPRRHPRSLDVSAAQHGGARGDQHGGAGFRRRSDQAGDAQRLTPSPPRATPRADAFADPR